MAQAQITPVETSFTGTGPTLAFVTAGGFNMSISGFGVATVDLQRSFDKGSNWKTVESFTADTERRVDDPEPGVYYRLNVSAYTSGTIVCRLSGGGAG